MIGLDRLKEIVSYNPDTGVMTKLKNGKSDWCKQKHGHMLVNVDGTTYKLHRLAWLYMTGNWPVNHIDHIDGDPTNNKWENLRDVTPSQNLRNQHRSKRDDCGVYRQKNRWIVVIRQNGKTNFCGSFVNKEDAVLRSLSVRSVRDQDIKVTKTGTTTP